MPTASIGCPASTMGGADQESGHPHAASGRDGAPDEARDRTRSKSIRGRSRPSSPIGGNKVVVLKGGPTVVAAPGGALWVAPGGNAALATAGTGDVLAGTIGGFLAQGLSPLDAAICGVHVGSRAAERAADAVGEYGMVAPDFLPAIAAAMHAIMGV